MRVLVCGDRNWRDYKFVLNTIEQIHQETPINWIITGAARGVDHCAHLAAHVLQIPATQFPANWQQYGKAAGPIRNQEMLDKGKPDLVLAFHNDLENSKGTKNMVGIARKAGVEVRIYDSR